MSYGEAWRLTQTLMADPSAMVTAAVNEWESPRSREWLLLAELYDLTHRANAAKPQQVKPYPRPFRDPNSRRHGRSNRPRAEVVAILNAHGHQIEGG